MLMRSPKNFYKILKFPRVNWRTIPERLRKVNREPLVIKIFWKNRNFDAKLNYFIKIVPIA